MKHEFGKSYLTSDAPESDEYPVIVFYQYSNPKVCSYAMDFDASGRSGTWRRLEQFPMVEPFIFKPKWAAEVELNGRYESYWWVSAKGTAGQYSAGPFSPTEREAIEAWNAMWERE